MFSIVLNKICISPISQFLLQSYCCYTVGNNYKDLHLQKKLFHTICACLRTFVGAVILGYDCWHQKGNHTHILFVWSVRPISLRLDHEQLPIPYQKKLDSKVQNLNGQSRWIVYNIQNLEWLPNNKECSEKKCNKLTSTSSVSKFLSGKTPARSNPALQWSMFSWVSLDSSNILKSLFITLRK